MTDFSCARVVETDRRQQKARTAFYSWFRKRRAGARRTKEQDIPHYVDLHEPRLFFLAIGALLLSITDYFFTLTLLQNGSEELNPVMDFFLQQSDEVFFIAKFSITVLCIMFLVMHKKFTLFGVISGYHIILANFVGYAVLVSYEVSMLIHLPLMNLG